MRYEISQGPLGQYMNNPRRYPSSKQGRDASVFGVSKTVRSGNDNVRTSTEYVSISMYVNVPM